MKSYSEEDIAKIFEQVEREVIGYDLLPMPQVEPIGNSQERSIRREAANLLKDQQRQALQKIKESHT